jgi:hypothetical protein
MNIEHAAKVVKYCTLLNEVNTRISQLESTEHPIDVSIIAIDTKGVIEKSNNVSWSFLAPALKEIGDEDISLGSEVIKAFVLSRLKKMRLHLECEIEKL